MDSGTGMEDYEALISTTDAEELLKRAWRTENRSTCSGCAGINCKYGAGGGNAVLMVLLKEMLNSSWPLHRYSNTVIILSQICFKPGHEETVDESMASGIDLLTVSLYQMELDRTLFLLRSYLRIHLQKIEKYMVHIHKTTELWNRLSKQEQKFAKRCIEDLEDHFENLFCQNCPIDTSRV
ncbi:hypothetical protein CsSME_00033039 [Camellia sinensis var. sinensis]